MFSEHHVYFTESNTYAGPFYTFQAAFNHLIRYKKDCRIEDKDGKVLATYSPWTGLFKVGVKYKYLVVNNQYNRENYPQLVGQVLDEAPANVIVQDVEAA